MSELKGKVAVVTGASKGIGAGIAKERAAAGAAVVVNYVSSKAGAERVVAEIAETGGTAIAVQGDVSKASDVRRLFAETRKAFGRLDVLVNNAGVFHFQPLEEVTEAEYRWHFDTNVLGPLLATQEAVKHFGPSGGTVINIGSCSDPVTAVRVAQAAEAAGFESVWTGEHIVLPDPDPQVPASPVPSGIGHQSRRRLAQHLDPKSALLDPAVSLAFVAAHTQRVKLGTGIIILPQRNPLVLAKELASVDVVSGGRLIFGLGVGFLKAEFDALGIPFTDKGERAIEYLQAMLAIWTQDKPEYHGRFFAFRGVQAWPRPAQSPHPPIVIGGHTPEAFRRALRHASGWYGFALDVDETARCVAGLEQAARDLGRPGGLAGFEISVTPAVHLDPDTVRRYADLGVGRLIPFEGGGEKELLEFVARTGDTLIGRF